MYIDYAIIDTYITEKEAKEKISFVLSHGVNGISLPWFLVKSCKSLINKEIDYSCFVDFPLGISDTKTRAYAVEQAISCGSNTIDICMQQNFASARKYDKIREDVKSIKNAAGKSKIKFILEYRTFDHRCLKKICEILDDFEIKFVLPSTGFFIDNLADNLIASAFLYENSKELDIIATGNAWSEKHYDIILRSGIKGIRTLSTPVVKNFFDYTNNRNNGV